MDRSITSPPRLSYPLTPPPTGGFDKWDSFGDTRFASTNSWLSTQMEEGELVTEFFEQPQEGSDVELSEAGEEIISLTNGTLPTSPVSNVSIEPNINPTNKHDLFGFLANPNNASTVTEPFPFLKLPLSMRNIVYEHLLVVPGLICVRQKHTAFYGSKEDQVHPEDRVLLPGISYALAQLTVNGPKAPFSHFTSTNINILRTSKEVLTEAKAALYSKNNFEIVKPSTELTPPSDFSVRLFPPGCQCLVTKLNIRIRSFYDLHYLLSRGYNDINNFYRGLDTLSLILELDSVSKGFGRQWAKNEGEKWHVYVKRLHAEVAKDALMAGKVAAGKGKKVKVIPTWINLRVLFSGESYDVKFNGAVDKLPEQAKRNELRNTLVEAWVLFKKGGR